VSSSYTFRVSNFFSGDRYTKGFAEAWTLCTDPATGDLICSEVESDPNYSLQPLQDGKEIIQRWLVSEGGITCTEWVNYARQYPAEGKARTVSLGTLVCWLIAIRNITYVRFKNQGSLSDLRYNIRKASEMKACESKYNERGSWWRHLHSPKESGDTRV
jgi:hypothetical protein